jgi:hypothetical protein
MRGKTPSLISGNAGSVKFVKAEKMRTCKRCHENIHKGIDCVEVSKPGSMGHRTYCLTCFSKIIDQSKTDLQKIRSRLEHLL